MSILDKKIREFEREPDNEDDVRVIPLDDDDVKKYIINMVREFDFSENNDSIDGDSTVIDFFHIYVCDDGEVEAYIYVNIQGAHTIYSHYYAGDYWNPPEWDVDEDPYEGWFEFYARYLNLEMTLKEVIDEVCKQTWECDSAVRELRELTSDPDNEPPEDW